MNTDLKQDVITALKSMGGLVKFGFVEFGKFALAAVIGISVTWALGYVFVNYLWQSLAVLAMALLCVWFLVELDNARANRESEEEDSK